MEKPTLYSTEPYGLTGGRAYLRMVHEVIPQSFTVVKLADYKRTYPTRRWRKVRHLWQIRKLLPFREDTYFLWDDISVILFSRKMLRKTIFIFHHYDLLQSDSQPFEQYMWQRLFSVIRHCYTVVCVSPYWAAFLAQKGIKARIIYNAFDTDTIRIVNDIEKAVLKEQFALPKNKIHIYLGKAVHWKGVEQVYEVLKRYPDIHLITTGNNTLNLSTDNYKLSYFDYLKLVRACDIGIFNSQLQEGWSRCAAETILLRVPCIIKPVAGLADLAHLTHAPILNATRLYEDIHTILAGYDTLFAYNMVQQFDTTYFSREWTYLLTNLLNDMG